VWYTVELYFLSCRTCTDIDDDDDDDDHSECDTELAIY